MEFSKILFWMVFVLAVGVTVFGCALMWHTGDTSALPVVISAAFTELASATCFYYWKAKNENRIKLMKRYKLPIEKDDIER